MSNEIGNRIKAVRSAKNITQKELAKLTNISYGAIQKYEQGLREPKFSILESISKALGISVSDLLAGDNEEFLVTSNEYGETYIHGKPEEMKAEILMNLLNVCHKLDYKKLHVLYLMAKDLLHDDL